MKDSSFSAIRRDRFLTALLQPKIFTTNFFFFFAFAIIRSRTYKIADNVCINNVVARRRAISRSSIRIFLQKLYFIECAGLDVREEWFYTKLKGNPRTM